MNRDDRIRLPDQFHRQRGDLLWHKASWYKYEEERSARGMTSLAGLPVYLDLASVLGLGDHIRARVHVRRSQGWTDEQIITSLVLLNLAGGDSVDDIRILRKDEGFSKVLPAPNERLQGLVKVNRDFVASVRRCRPHMEATIDADATITETHKEDAFFSYKGRKAYPGRAPGNPGHKEAVDLGLKNNLKYIAYSAYNSGF